MTRRRIDSRRREAAELLKRGVKQVEVARRLGVTPKTVNVWARLLRQEGRAGLETSSKPGRRARLDDQQMTAVIELLRLGPRAIGSDADRWTVELAARAIDRRFGVHYGRTQTTSLLRRAGCKATKRLGWIIPDG